MTFIKKLGIRKKEMIKAIAAGYRLYARAMKKSGQIERVKQLNKESRDILKLLKER
jgi:hypothetical protein